MKLHRKCPLWSVALDSHQFISHWVNNISRHWHIYLQVYITVIDNDRHTIRHLYLYFSMSRLWQTYCVIYIHITVWWDTDMSEHYGFHHWHTFLMASITDISTLWLPLLTYLQYGFYHWHTYIMISISDIPTYGFHHWHTYIMASITDIPTLWLPSMTDCIIISITDIPTLWFP